MAKETAPTPSDRTTQQNRPARRAAPATARSSSSRAGAEQVKRRGPNIVEFVKESRSELRKVTWPTRQEAMNLTGAVIVMTAVLSAFLGLVDAILNYAIKPIIGAG